MKLQPTLPIVILGDFNINSHEHSAKYTTVSKVMRKLNCKQVIKDYTRDSRTTTDLIFTNIRQDKYISGALESYFSYHKQYVFVLPNRQHCFLHKGISREKMLNFESDDEFSI